MERAGGGRCASASSGVDFYSREMNEWTTRHWLLVRLGYESYGEYLQSSHWSETRKRYFASGRSLDCICGEPSVALHH